MQPKGMRSGATPAKKYGHNLLRLSAPPWTSLFDQGRQETSPALRKRECEECLVVGKLFFSCEVFRQTKPESLQLRAGPFADSDNSHWNKNPTTDPTQTMLSVRTHLSSRLLDPQAQIRILEIYPAWRHV